MPFSNANLDEKLMNGTSRQISVDSSNTITSDLDRLSSIESQNACVNEQFVKEENHPCKYQILNQHSSNLDPNGIRLQNDIWKNTQNDIQVVIQIETQNEVQVNIEIKIESEIEIEIQML